MTSNELLDIDPVELRIAFELKKQISSSLQLTSKTDDYVAFKVKTTNPKKYCVRPNAGIVPPRSTCDIVVTMQAQREAPADLQCKDKFLIQSVIVEDGANAKSVTPEMFSKESGHALDEMKLRVVYISPPRPPSPVAEGSEEGSPSRPSYSDNENSSASELVSTTQEYSEKTKDRSSQSSTLISRLREENTAAMQANYRLQQEIELVRREISKQQKGFSFTFVVIIALLGILLGYW